MKNFTLVLFLTTSILTLAQTEKNTYNFDNDTEAFFGEGGNVSATPSGFITFSPISNYARIVQKTNYINAYENKTIRLRISNQSSTNNVLSLSVDGKAIGNIEVSTNDGNSFKEYVFKITSNKWIGNVSEFKLFPRNSETKMNDDDGALIIDYIIFSKK
ncbi:hypothetical protein ACFQ1R_13865 [Mariniflexile jejuense]|uniref:Carbohydrate binding protein with CBM6 domain n=1 Tax=Mariniflexile jejuense TaxID=1173582 RepID=A0ABW3JMT5_9FLAO